MITKGKWLSSAFAVYVGGKKILDAVTKDNTITDLQDDLDITCDAVNACKSINPDNPQAVAEQIVEMHDALRDMGTLYAEYTRLNPKLSCEGWDEVQRIVKHTNEVLAKCGEK